MMSRIWMAGLAIIFTSLTLASCAGPNSVYSPYDTRQHDDWGAAGR